jgi:menaquinol-cytochrome c reductase cytochrome b/c subunit
VPPQQQRGAEVMASSGCLACHKVGDNGGDLGPNLSHIGDTLGKDAIARTLVNPTSPMPSYRSFQQQNPREFDELVNFVASLRSQD